jgi:glucokinase
VSEPSPVLAIDIGGTKLAAALVDRCGAVSHRCQVVTEPTAAGCGHELWATLDGLIDEVVGDTAVAGVGLGCGGPMDWAAGAVSPLNIPAWRAYPLRQRLCARFPAVPVRLHNDAIAMAVGEHWCGSGRGSDSFLGVVVSTGVGGGLVLGGGVLSGETGNAGHVGHVVVDPDGPDCACGGRGCLEAIARGPAVVRWALDNGWQPADEEADGRALVSAAHNGDRVAVAAFERAGEAIGIAVASTAHLLELDRVAVGGGLSNAGDLLFGPARIAFASHARMAFAARCEIVPAELGGDAGLIGAAAFVHVADRYWPGAD